jgi:hypothetical protein
MAYGQARMLGDTIDPRLAAVDYSPYVNAANIQAQSIADLGKTVAGGIDQFTEYKKKQKEDEKMVMKSQRVAQAIGDLIPDLQPTIQNSLMILEDKERPLSERVAEASAISDILAFGTQEIRSRQDRQLQQNQIDAALQQSQYSAGARVDAATIKELAAQSQREEDRLYNEEKDYNNKSVFKPENLTTDAGIVTFKQNDFGVQVDANNRVITDFAKWVNSGGKEGTGEEYKIAPYAATQYPDGIQPQGYPMPTEGGEIDPVLLIDENDPKDSIRTTGNFAADTASPPSVQAGATAGQDIPTNLIPKADKPPTKGQEEAAYEKEKLKLVTTQALRTIDFYIDENGKPTNALGESVGFGEKLKTSVAKMAPYLGTQSGREQGQQKELIGLLEGDILEAAKYLKPASNLDLKRLEASRPGIENDAETWAKHLVKVREILNNRANYLSGKLPTENDGKEEVIPTVKTPQKTAEQIKRDQLKEDIRKFYMPK